VVAWVKLLHVTAIAFWTGGLVCLLFMHPKIATYAVSADIRHVMHRALSAFVAPAAYVAIGSGAWLIFLRETFVPWFTLKLIFVGLLIIVHMLIARSIMKLFDHSVTNTRWYVVSLMGVLAVAAMGILVLVLWKPEIDLAEYAAINQPGALQEVVRGYWPFETWPFPE
jgi:protoporphyrinogen IX oxidase